MSRIPSLSLPEEATWRVVLFLGGILALTGALELVLLWVPPKLGPPEWASGTTATFLDRFPQFGLGITLLLAAGIVLGLRGTVRSLAVLCIIVSVLLWLSGFIYVTALPYVLQVAKPPLIHVQVEKAMSKAGLQALLYPFLMIILAWRSWRATAAAPRA